MLTAFLFMSMFLAFSCEQSEFQTWFFWTAGDIQDNGGKCCELNNYVDAVSSWINRRLEEEIYQGHHALSSWISHRLEQEIYQGHQHIVGSPFKTR